MPADITAALEDGGIFEVSRKDSPSKRMWRRVVSENAASMFRVSFESLIGRFELCLSRDTSIQLQHAIALMLVM